ncbi:MAG: antirestriction protein ArdA [Clostridium fessum]
MTCWGLYDYLDEYEDIDELNHLAHVLEEVRDNGELEKYEAALVLGKHTASVKDLINLAQNLNIYNFQPGIETWEALGCYYADELMTIHIPSDIRAYFDYEAYGRDIAINEGGCFAPAGYVSAAPLGFTEYYHGTEDIPAEHRVFAYPNETPHSILETLKQLKKPRLPRKRKRRGLPMRNGKTSGQHGPRPQRRCRQHQLLSNQRDSGPPRQRDEQLL